MVGAWCFGCLSGPPRFTCWISFAPIFSFIYYWVLIFALPDLYVLWDDALISQGSFMQTKYLCVLIHIWIKGEVGAVNRLKPSSKIFYWPFKGGTTLWIFYVFSVLCLLCVCARLFICALWSPAGKGLTSWLSFLVSNCEFVTFPLVSRVRCVTWLYRFLIFAPLLTYNPIANISKWQYDIGVSSQENLSLGFPTKRVSDHSPPLQIQARKLKFHL